VIVWNGTEGNTKGMNGYKIDMDDERKPEEITRITVFDKIYNNKHLYLEG
jgi:hypothetical protein